MFSLIGFLVILMSTGVAPPVGQPQAMKLHSVESVDVGGFTDYQQCNRALEGRVTMAKESTKLANTYGEYRITFTGACVQK